MTGQKAQMLMAQTKVSAVETKSCRVIFYDNENLVYEIIEFRVKDHFKKNGQFVAEIARYFVNNFALGNSYVIEPVNGED